MANVDSFVISSALLFPSIGKTAGVSFQTQMDDVSGQHKMKTLTDINSSAPIEVFNTSPLSVNITDQTAGTKITLASAPTGTTGGLQILINEVVPAGEKWVLQMAKVICVNQGFYQLSIDGVMMDFGITSPSESNLISPFNQDVASSGQTVTLSYTSEHGPTGNDLMAFLRVTQSP